MRTIDIDFFEEDIPNNTDITKLKGPKPISQDKSARRKKQTDHTKRVTDYWGKLGYRCDKLESWQNVNGMWVRKDFVGCFDFLCTKKGEPPYLIQVSAKGDVRTHLRKMLGDTEVKGGETRRHAFDYYFSLSWPIAIMWLDQPGGHGSAWQIGLEIITPELIADIDAGRRTKRQ